MLTETMILDYIVSTNIQRRHLNAGQRAMLALRYEEIYAQAAKQAQRAAGGNKIHPRSSDQPKSVSADLHSAYDRKATTKAARVTGASGRGA